MANVACEDFLIGDLNFDGLSQDTPRLKWVDLSHSSKLHNLSALSKAENLQRLNLEGCTNLKELPKEIQNMKSLIFLNLRGCIHLSSLPQVNLASLKTLILSDCSNLKEFQLISESLEYLHLDGTAINGLPPTIQNLQKLFVLNLKNCKMLELLPNCLGELKGLEELILSGCSRLKNLPDVRHSMKHLQILLFDRIGAEEMPNISSFTRSKGQASANNLLQPLGSYCSLSRGVNGVSLLQRLCLSGNNFVSLRTEISELYNLKWLEVQQCRNLRSVPMLPPSLQYFNAHGCVSLERVANPLAHFIMTDQIHATFNFSNCNKLDLEAKDSIISYIWRKSQLVLNAVSENNEGNASEAFIGTCYPGREVPAQFNHQAYGSVLKPKLPPHWFESRFTGISICAVILVSDSYDQRNRLVLKCNYEFKNPGGACIRFSCTVGGWSKVGNTPQNINASHVFCGYTSRMDILKHGMENDEHGCICTQASIEFQVTDGTQEVGGCEVLKCGFSLVYACDGTDTICWDAKTNEIPKRIENVSAVSSFHGHSRGDDDIQYKSYSSLTLAKDENLHNEEKSDATFKNKRIELLNKPRGEITVSAEKPNMLSFLGFELRLKQLESLLYSTPGKTRIVGVVGMPGIGKTALTTVLFEKRGCKFPSNLFLSTSKEYQMEERRMLLEELLKHVEVNISDETTHESVKEKLLQTKCFVVLDDVSGKKQLEFLLGDLNWIKKGSKIIISTCDMSLLEGLAHDTYLVPVLNNIEAFNIFSYHAFDGQICSPTGTLLMLSKMFVDIVGGNPLALMLIGKELRGKYKAYWDWEHEPQTMIQSSNVKIQDMWTLNQLVRRQKDVFLDILCFFRSEDEYFVRSLLDLGDPDSTHVMSELIALVNKCLINIFGSCVEMNDIWSTFADNLGSLGRHRLFKYQDIIDKLKKIKKAEANNVRGIYLDMSELKRTIALERTTFINMHNLRYLKIYNSCCPRQCEADCKLNFPDGLDFPFEEVRYFYWLKFPLEELPSNFRPENLVDLRLPYSKIERLWEGVKDAPRLKWVDLSHSSKLHNLSALSKAENLQRLNLEGCTNLKELPKEIQNMKSLIFLNLRGCTHLSSLPQVNLASLKTLILSGCSNLREFQLISENLAFLHLDGTAIKGLPMTIRNLQKLVVLNLKNCKMLELLPNCLGKLKVLEVLILSGCSRLKNLPNVRHSMKYLQILLFDKTGAEEMPKISNFMRSEGQDSQDMLLQPLGSYSNMQRGVYCVSSLQRLCLSGNDCVSLQTDIVLLGNLKWLDVKHCKKLRSVPMLPPRLQYFNAHGCDSLERVANPLALLLLVEQNPATFNFTNCTKLNQDAKDSIISYSRWKNLLVLDTLSRYNGGTALEAFSGTCFPGWEVPVWFSHRASGSVLGPKLPRHWFSNRFIGIALCAVIQFPEHHDHSNISVKCSCTFENQDGFLIHINCTIGGWNDPSHTPLNLESSHIFIGYVSRLEFNKVVKDENEERCEFTKTSLAFHVTDGCEVLTCGLNLVYAPDERENLCWETTTVPSEVPKPLWRSPSDQDITRHLFNNYKSDGKLKKPDDVQHPSSFNPLRVQVKNFKGEAKYYGKSPRNDDNKYSPYSKSSNPYSLIY